MALPSPFVNVEAETFGEGYNKLLLKVYDEGRTSEKESYAYKTEKDELFRECESRFAITDALKEPMLSLAMPGLDKFPDYVGDVLLGEKDYLVKQGTYTYTYHERLDLQLEVFRKILRWARRKLWSKFDISYGGQLAYVIKRLGEHPFSNRAQAVTWRIPKDTFMESGQPCLQRIWFKVYGNTLLEHTDWRSRDLTYALDENVAGMLGVGKLVMDCSNDYFGLGLSRLYYVDRCNSLHVYGKDANFFENTVNGIRKGRARLLSAADPIPRRLWKGRELFEAVNVAKEEIFDPIFKK